MENTDGLYETEGPRRLPKMDKEEEPDKTMTPKEVTAAKRTIIRHIMAVSAAFVFLIAAMQGLAVLQSSINQEVGVWGLCVNFAAVVVSCLFFSAYIVQRLGCKWAMVMGMVCMMTWIFANLYPTWATIIPGSIVMGMGWAPLWTAQCTFFTVSGVKIAEITKQMPDQIIARGFGFFFMAFMTGPIWGNLISSSILSQGDKDIPKDDMNSTKVMANQSFHDIGPVLQCGADFCPRVLKSLNGTAIEKPSQKLILILVGVYLALAFIAVLIVILFVPNIRAHDDPKRNSSKTKKAKFSLKLCAQTLKQLSNRLQLFMVPLNLYIGLEEGFTMVEYSMAFVSCNIGVSLIGFVAISYALMAAIFSFTSGHMIRLVGRLPVFTFAFLTHIALNITWMIWKPGMGGRWVFFVFSGCWGIGDAIMQTQTNAFYGLMFKDNTEAAFSNYRMWEAFGIIVALSYSSYLCVNIKLYILMTVLIIGAVGYYITEVLYRKQLAREAEEEDRKHPEVFHDYANVIRRKSHVVVPHETVNIAKNLIRRNSQEEPHEVMRKISAFAPHVESSQAPERRNNNMRQRKGAGIPEYETNEDNEVDDMLPNIPISEL